MTELTIVIPGEPQGKERPRFNTKTGSVYTPPKTKSAEALVAQHVKAAFVGWGDPPYAPTERVHVTLLFVSHKGRKDVDNCAKLTMDALNRLVWNDDAQVSDLHASIRRGKEYGEARTEITLRWEQAKEEAA